MDKEKLKIPRQKMKEQSPKERIKNFNEVPFGFTEEEAVLEAKRCIQCKKPFCIDGCPVGIDIPGFIKCIAQKDFKKATAIMRRDNSLPAVCGRVCPQETQCEIKCVLSKKFGSVAIGALERFIADYELEKLGHQVPKIREKTNKKVAIVGAGPAGLTCAGELAKMGHEVTIFEALHKAGGVLIYGIPEFRMPKRILEEEVNYLKKLGVTVKLNYIIGRIYTVDELFLSGFNAVFIGTGAGAPKFMGIEGENLNGIFSANEFLTRANLMKAYLFPEYDTPIFKGKKVAVLGAGNTAMDAARVALRLKAENVYIVYRRSDKEMPARAEEIKHAKEEGVEFLLLTNPKRFIGDEKGYLKSMECLKMELGAPDESGRRRPVTIVGSEFEIEVDTAISALGTYANPVIADTTPDLDINKWGYIIADEGTAKTNKKGIWAGGDIVTGSATVVDAMGWGKNAAKNIDNYLK